MLPNRLTRWWQGRNSVSVFCFHSIVESPLAVSSSLWMTRAAFERQLDEIAMEFEVLRLETALDRLWKGNLNRPVAALTFDDGFRNQYEVALPILRRKGWPATLFLCTGPQGTGRPLWFTRLQRAFCRTKLEAVSWQGREFSMATLEEKGFAAAKLHEEVRRSEPDRIDDVTDKICRDLEVEGDGEKDAEFGHLDAVLIAAMAREGTIRFGAHTRTHHTLSRLSPARQREEIVGSITDVGRMTGKSPSMFAYPQGGPADFTSHSEKILDEMGLEAAFSLIESPCSRRDSRFRLPRYVMAGD